MPEDKLFFEDIYSEYEFFIAFIERSSLNIMPLKPKDSLTTKTKGSEQKLK